ncbi:S9 family peptidase [Runella slithyformis]|uniref:Proline-specific endopeptidase n=1 Tax=Runella slithyformis (strain ATCC 29530 / DSM 19594 / LMG 11500 / NCIMB 11436 / LSU 4) TaxID=761193 RepID=A0A7U4E5W3_RUNSL|nr:oligopeptidase B [Runella slithyformis]AEI48613.1 Oligopeptidase B [Runella slithyformis DSM 19594]
MTPHQTSLQPPKAPKVPYRFELHNDVRTDDYYWLRERESPEVINYLNAENAYTEAVLAPVKQLREKLFDEMKARIKEQDESVPYKMGNYYYYYRYEPGAEYPVYCRRRNSPEATEEVMLNINELAEGHAYYNATFPEIADNEEIAAFGEDTVSRRLYTLKFKNLITGEIYPDAIPDTEGGNYAWASDHQTIFYIRKHTDTLLGFQVWRHRLGMPVSDDVLVYEEADDRFYLGLYRMKSKKYITIVSDQNGVSTEYQLIRADDPTGQCVSFLPRQRGLEYFIEHLDDAFYVRTNLDGATNFKLMSVSESLHHDLLHWRELIAHRPDVYLEGMEAFQHHLVLQERGEGLLKIRIINQQTREEHYLNFGEPTYTAYLSNNPDFNTPVLRYGYTSLTTPNSTFDYDMDSRERTLLKQQEVLGDFDRNGYQTERLFAPSRDGILIPISIVYKKGFQKDGTAPLLQYSYGSYGYSTDPTFSTGRLSLLNRGFAFAIAHIRGGQEMGRAWYENGKMLHKKNTFTDFIDCSAYLIQTKWTSPEGLFAIGGSAGGLLMGAVVNMAPQLYKGVVAQVPFVDVVTTMLDETIPLTTGEYEEWGNPNEKIYYDYMKSYSPYDNVVAQEYPNMLVTTGLHDSQVQYWEPAKWVAKLRELKTDHHQLLLHCDMEAGHGGASGRFKSLKDVALVYSFMLNLLGITA